MFDIGLTELVLISVIALIVVGPERLPTAARTAGAWFGRMRRMLNNVKYDVQRELAADDLRKSLTDDGKLGSDLNDFGRALTEDILNPSEPAKSKPSNPAFEGRTDENGDWVPPWVDDPDSAPDPTAPIPSDDEPTTAKTAEGNPPE